MATLRDLKKRLNGVKTAGQLAGAMKTVSTVKYSRLAATVEEYSRYAALCGEFFAQYGAPSCTESGAGRNFRVLFSGNRGLCGGYHSELFAFFDTQTANDDAQTAYIACGKEAAEHFRQRGITPVRVFEFSDVPTFQEAAELSRYLRELRESGAASRIQLIYQHFVNIAKQTPTCRDFGLQADSAEQEPLFVPDEATVRQALGALCPDAAMYSFVLRCALGVQSATLMAMRAACDHAEESAAELETAIHSQRQSAVTAGVIETASENIQ